MNIESFKEEFFMGTSSLYLDKTFNSLIPDMIIDAKYLMLKIRWDNFVLKILFIVKMPYLLKLFKDNGISNYRNLLLSGFNDRLKTFRENCQKFVYDSAQDCSSYSITRAKVINLYFQI